MGDYDAIIEYLRKLEQKIDRLSEQLVAEQKKKNLLGEWVSEKEIRALTSLSRGILLKLRQEGKISRSTIAGKKNYYRLSDFKKLLDKNEREN